MKLLIDKIDLKKYEENFILSSPDIITFIATTIDQYKGLNLLYRLKKQFPDVYLIKDLETLYLNNVRFSELNRKLISPYIKAIVSLLDIIFYEFDESSISEYKKALVSHLSKYNSKVEVNLTKAEEMISTTFNGIVTTFMLLSVFSLGAIAYITYSDGFTNGMLTVFVSALLFALVSYAVVVFIRNKTREVKVKV